MKIFSIFVIIMVTTIKTSNCKDKLEVFGSHRNKSVHYLSLEQLIVRANCSKNDNGLVYYDCKQIVGLEKSSSKPTIERKKCAEGQKEITEKIYFLKRSNRSHIYTAYTPIGCENGLAAKKYTVEDIKSTYIPAISAKKTMNGKSIYKFNDFIDKFSCAIKLQTNTDDFTALMLVCKPSAAKRLGFEYDNNFVQGHGNSKYSQIVFMVPVCKKGKGLNTKIVDFTIIEQMGKEDEEKRTDCMMRIPTFCS